LIYINVNKLNDEDGEYVLQIANNISVENDNPHNLNSIISYRFDDIVYHDADED